MSLLIFSAAVQSSLSLTAAADGEGAAVEGTAEADVAAGPAVVEGFSSPHPARPSTAQVRRIGKIRFDFTPAHASRRPSLIKLGLPGSALGCAGGTASRRPPACPAAVRRGTGRLSTRTVLPYPAPRASSVARWAERSPLLVGLRRRDPGGRVLDARLATTRRHHAVVVVDHTVVVRLGRSGCSGGSSRRSRSPPGPCRPRPGCCRRGDRPPGTPSCSSPCARPTPGRAAGNDRRRYRPPP